MYIKRDKLFYRGGKLKVVLALGDMNSMYIAAICGGISAALAMMSKDKKDKNKKK